ncbi:serine hydrolase domain-containing protein [Hyphobacterium marinum]|uniref:Serine hydrolase domain-containing protein n=1 Tax=Hyphobacterium marinum TaxID=3116574 RepID=A0ABU7LVB6_9PROT|nr:serine hydrolase domain-containing protein [Hyphobacterium sp. Y6023]MEE2565503.1 serine hydrolase domain-containing protein [Hyphobacterium sp. Y6023]
MTIRMSRREMVAGTVMLSGVALTGCAPGGTSTPDWLNAWAETRLQDFNLTGMTAGLALPGGQVLAAAAGLSDRDTGEVMRPDHLMQAGSTGKTFVAASAAKLILDGRLNPDAPISTWLSDRPWWNDLAHRDAITVRHCLTHRTGLVEYLEQPGFGPLHADRLTNDPDRPILSDESLPLAIAAGPLFTPGESFSYADTNYLLAGLVIEAVTGERYESFVIREILEPHRLMGGIVPATQRHIPGLASSRMESPPFGLPQTCAQDETLVMHPMTEWTGGGMATRAGDLARWGRLWFGGNVFSGDYLTLISDAEPGSGVIVREGEDWRYGMACECRVSPGPALIGHRGWFPAYMSVLAYRDDLDIAAALQFNTVPSVPDLYQLAETLIERAALDA